jgi:peptidoglycan/xylan/chitin deacetylase (PgdA/CDA1 family)
MLGQHGRVAWLLQSRPRDAFSMGASEIVKLRMSRRSTNWLKAALGALHATGAATCLAPWAQGDGAIVMLHQVLPGAPKAFEPNRILRITPEFLDQTIRQVIESGYEIISLDEVAQRLANRGLTNREPSTRPFVCFTLDDGYRDNLVHAYPVFRRYGVPFTIYIPTDYIDGNGELWWLALEQALAALDHVDVSAEGGPAAMRLACASSRDRAYHAIYWWLRGIDETVARRIVRDLCRSAGVSVDGLCRELIMTWDELRAMAADPLVTIGAHTRRHYALARLGDGAARAEMVEGLARLERELGRKVRHFSYPFGDETAAGPRDFALAQELGFATAVTTRKGMVTNDLSANALPRLSLNGDYQDARFVDVLLTGVPFALRNLARRFAPRRVDAMSQATS